MYYQKYIYNGFSEDSSFKKANRTYLNLKSAFIEKPELVNKFYSKYILFEFIYPAIVSIIVFFFFLIGLNLALDIKIFIDLFQQPQMAFATSLIIFSIFISFIFLLHLFITAYSKLKLKKEDLERIKKYYSENHTLKEIDEAFLEYSKGETKEIEKERKQILKNYKI